jgi:hypothetical protein
MRTARILTITAVVLAAVSAFGQQASNNQPINNVIAYMAKKYLGQEIQASVQAAAANQINNSRNDQQTTAASGGAAATSVTDKAGIADLLSVAIERGAITKSASGTSTTLTSTPYAWMTAFGTKDTTENWKRYAWARKISLSSTFSSEDVTKGDFSSFANGEVKFVVAGDRSARDVEIPALPGVDALAAVINKADALEFATCTSQLIPILGEQRVKDAFAAKDQTALDEAFAGYTPDPAGLKVIRQCVTSVTSQFDADKFVRAQLPKLIATYLQKQNKFQLSIAGLYQRDASISDFYSVKLLSDYNPAAGNAVAADTANPAATANLNAQVDFNQHNQAPDGTNLHQVRSYSLEAAANSARFAERRLDATLSVKAQRSKENEAKTIGIVQGKLNVHVSSTLMVPIALSYANREDNIVKKGFQISVGFAALLDELMSKASAR